MQKKLTFIISTKNNEDNLIKLLDSYIQNSELLELTNMIIINDCSDYKYDLVLQKIKNFNNITYLQNSINKGKVRTFIDAKQYVKTNFVCLIDDKDCFINHDEWINVLKKMNILNYEIYCFYMCNSELKIIGNKMNQIDTYHEFYIKKGLIGDHIFFISTKYYKNFKIPNEFQNRIINNELFFLQDIFYIKYFVLTNKPLLIHDYKKGNITKNLIHHKINNYEVTFYVSNLVLKQKPCLKIRIINLFNLFLIRHNKKVFNFLIQKDKSLYYLLYLTFSFLVIKKLYLRKLNKITK